MKKALMLALLITAAAFILGVGDSAADSGYFTSKGCVNCHGSSAFVETCTGCHAMGVHTNPKGYGQQLNLIASVPKTVYLPGEMIPVYISGGYHDGWCRIVLYDQNMTELARSASTMRLPGAIAPCCGPSFGYNGGVTLSSPAPLVEGTYTWNAAWYGNKFDNSDSPTGYGTSYYGPRWTPDPNNPNHGSEIISTNSFIVSAVPIPIARLAPTSVEFGSVAIGGTSSAKSVSLSNTGTADLHVTSIAPCDAASDEFSWTPSAPFTVVANAASPRIGTTKTLSVTYRPLDAGADSGCLAITTDDPNTPQLHLAVSGFGYVPMTLDLDIAGFSVTNSIPLKSKASISIKLSVLNPGTVSGSAMATVTGTRNGIQVYSQSLSVSDATGDSSPTVFTFPSYKPTATGTITWTATIADSNADVDAATATTTATR